MGGLARRVSYLQAFRKTFAQTQVIELNAGYSLNDAGVMANPPLKDIAVQNTYALRAYSRFPFDAFNISFHDLPVLSQYLEKVHQKANFAEFPALKTLVSANLTPEADQKTHLPIAPYIIRELKSPRFPKGKLRVGITGFSEPAPGANQGYVWREVEKTATEVLPELRKKVDLVVVMAYLPVDQAQNLCRNHPEIDVCIAAYTKVFQAPIEKFGNAQFVMSNYETKNLGELRISFGPKGELTVTNRFVPLDSQIPDEPAAAQLVQETKTAVDAAQKAMVQQMQNH
ncbi:MAG: hypothetical protein K1Y36_04945 [Blastocatellia bacterium]|nr:hypothetical protein [Blastocatellia bacterium]